MALNAIFLSILINLLLTYSNAMYTIQTSYPLFKDHFNTLKQAFFLTIKTKFIFFHYISQIIYFILNNFQALP